MRRTEAETAAIVDHHRAVPQYAGRTLVSPNGLFERDPVQWGDACDAAAQSCTTAVPIRHAGRDPRCVVCRPGSGTDVSELAERTGSALSGVHREIARLSSATLIVERQQGANRLVRPNLEHPASGPIQEILRLDLQS